MKKPTDLGVDRAPDPGGPMWMGPPRRHGELTQNAGDAIRSARGFLVGDKLWFTEYPESGHQQWWDDEIRHEYNGEDYQDLDDVLYFRISPGGDIVVNYPLLPDAGPDDVRRLVAVLRTLDVPPNEVVQWTAGLVADQRTAAEYEGLV